MQDDKTQDTRGEDERCSEFWRQVGKSHRHVAILLRGSGYNEANLIKEVQRLGMIFDEGAKFYTQNDQDDSQSPAKKL